jgi:hypothetical protein
MFYRGAIVQTQTLALNISLLYAFSRTCNGSMLHISVKMFDHHLTDTCISRGRDNSIRLRVDTVLSSCSRTPQYSYVSGYEKGETSVALEVRTGFNGFLQLYLKLWGCGNSVGSRRGVPVDGV